MKKYLFIGFLFSFFILKATQNKDYDSLFDKANQFQQQNQFQEALKLYQEIENSSAIPSQSVFYNKGNCYYHLKEWGYARAYFEKALKLAPTDEQTLINLNLTLKEIEGSSYKKIDSIDHPLQLFTQHTWLLVALLFTVLICFSFLLFKISTNPKIKTFFLMTFIIIGIFLAFSLIGYSSYFFEEKEAVIISKSEVYENPVEKSTKIKILNSGQKVWVLEKIENWIQIKQGENTFWIKSNHLIEI
ncbi:MAG: tetratricopeptide repeat protein [Flavobacteriales bacterium]